MAIKTIRKGKIPPPPVLAGTCPRCNWMGECDVSDAKVSNDPREAVTDYYIACPTCGGQVTMAVKRVRDTGGGCSARDDYM